MAAQFIPENYQKDTYKATSAERVMLKEVANTDVLQHCPLEGGAKANEDGKSAKWTGTVDMLPICRDISGMPDSLALSYQKVKSGEGVIEAPPNVSHTVAVPLGEGILEYTGITRNGTVVTVTAKKGQGMVIPWTCCPKTSVMTATSEWMVINCLSLPMDAMAGTKLPTLEIAKKQFRDRPKDDTASKAKYRRLMDLWGGMRGVEF